MRNRFGHYLQKNSIKVWILFCGLFVGIFAGRMPIVRAEAETLLEQPAGQENAAAGEGIEELPVDKLVIVIDPGHGGEEEGGMYDSFVAVSYTHLTLPTRK